MYDWRIETKGNDPNCTSVQEKLYKYIMINSEEVLSWEEVVLKKCRGRRVLDIGGIAHNKEQIKSDVWKHKKLMQAAQYIVGVDILENLVKWINKKGYNFKYADATSDIYLGEKFDIVFGGDIIEHMDNVKGLLNFAKRHLQENGSILISTPNPHFINSFLNYLPCRGGFTRDNMEHTCWITPTYMNELCYRTNLKLKKTYFIEKKYNKIWNKLLPMEWRTHTFIFELTFSE